MRLGVIDSGVGGLSLVRPCVLDLPWYVYYSDAAFMPWGSKSADFVQERCRLLVTSMIEEYSIDTLLIACHTASALSAGFLRREFEKVRIISLVEPTVEHALKISREGRIAFLATPATVASGVYSAYYKSLRQPTVLSSSFSSFASFSGHFLQIPGGDIAYLVEHHAQDRQRIATEVARVLAPLQDHAIDTLILGSTHYAHIKDSIGEFVGSGVTLMGAEDVIPGLFDARRSPSARGQACECGDPVTQSKPIFCTTGDADAFAKRVQHIVGVTPLDVRKLML